MSQPAKAKQYVFDIPGLMLSGSFVNNPTISTGDAKLSKDGSGFVNLTNLPTVHNTRVVSIDLTAAEMNADRLFIQLKDPDGTWEPIDILINTETDISNIFNTVAILNDLNPQPTSEVIDLIKGDAYDGVSWPKLSWVTTEDVTGLNVIFTVRELDDYTTGSPILTETSTGSGTDIEIELTSAQTNAFVLNKGKKSYNFDLEVEFDTGSYKTVARGVLNVSIDQTRR